MKKQTAARLISIITVIIMITALFASCGRRPIYDDPTKSAVPTAAATEKDALTTEEPRGTEASEPDGTSDPSVTPDGASPAPTDPADQSHRPPDTDGPDATEPGHDTSPEPTAEPGVTDVPTETPKPADQPAPVSGPLWIYSSKKIFSDLDFDGSPERIDFAVIPGATGVKCSVEVTVGKNGAVIRDEFTIKRFLKAYLNDFNKGDGRAELLVSVAAGTCDHFVRCYRLNADSSAFVRYAADGWLETASAGSVVIGRYYDLMGTWKCTAEHVLSRSGFVLEKTSEMWEVVREDGRWCTVADELIVGIYTSGGNNESVYLDRGDVLYPVSTDLEGIINVRLESGADGYIVVTFGQDGKPLMNGVPMDELFSDLTYIN